MGVHFANSEPGEFEAPKYRYRGSARQGDPRTTGDGKPKPEFTAGGTGARGETRTSTDPPAATAPPAPLTSPEVREAIREAWEKSVESGNEHGGDFVLGEDGVLRVAPYPPGQGRGVTPTQEPPGPPYGAFHTHPNQGINPETGLYWNPAPSGRPTQTKGDIGKVLGNPGRFAPHYVIGHPGVWRIDASGKVTFEGTRTEVLGQ